MCVELHNAAQYWITVLCHLSGSSLSWTLPWCQSCSDIVQMWVYFTVTSLFYSALNLYLELAELGRTNPTFDEIFFTCIRQVELRPLQLLCGWLFFLKTGSWIPVIPMIFRLHITLQHLFWCCFVAAWEIHGSTVRGEVGSVCTSPEMASTASQILLPGFLKWKALVCNLLWAPGCCTSIHIFSGYLMF